MPLQATHRLTTALIVVTCSIVFIVDYASELGVASGVPYLGAIWLAFTSGNERTVRITAIVCSVLTVAGIVVAPDGGELWKAAVNRALVLSAIWLTTEMSLRNLRSEKRRQFHQEELDRTIASLQQRRLDQEQRSRAMLSMMEDLHLERQRLRDEVQQREHAEQALQSSERRTRRMIDVALDAVITIDMNGIVTDWNPQAEQMFGWARNEAVGQRMELLIVPPQYREAHRKGLEAYRATGAGPNLNRRLEFTALNRNGEHFPIELAISPLHLAERTLFTAFVRDITEQKRAEETRNRLAAIIESSDDAIFGKTLQGIITSWNHGAETLYGYTAQEMIGEPVARLVPSEHHDEVPRILARLQRGESINRYETVRVRKDGKLLAVSLTISPIKDAEGKLIGAATIARDITERKRMEQRFRATIEAAPTAMVMINTTGRIVLVNAETERLFGYGRDELLGQAVEILVPHRFRTQHPGLRDGFFVNPAARRMGAGRDLYGLHKTGAEFPVEIGLNPVQTEEAFFVLSAIVDITDRKNAEEQIRRYAEELERSNRELDQFAYSASHDLKAPLRAVDNLAMLIADDAGELLPEQCRADLQLMQQRICRMERLLNDLLEYSRVGRSKHSIEEVDMTGLVHDIIELLAPPEAFTIEIGNLPTVRTAKVPLEQMIRNLIGNAIKHHNQPNGRIEVSAQTIDDHWIEFVVADNGPGIPAEYHETVFEPFHTLRPRDEVEGSGMGLALVKKTVEYQGGTVVLESAAGEGARFRCTWPIAHD